MRYIIILTGALMLLQREYVADCKVEMEREPEITQFKVSSSAYNMPNYFTANIIVVSANSSSSF